MEKLFSYGTLQLEGVQIDTFGRKIDGTPDVLMGYILTEIKITDQKVIQSSGTDIHPILKFTGHNEDEVIGTVLDITREELAQADEYEVEDYQRVSAKLKSGGVAWIYADARQ